MNKNTDNENKTLSLPLQRLTFTAVLSAIALVAFVIEAQLPSLTSVPGIKLGLANIFTLLALYVVGEPWALALLVIRVVLGSVFSGQMSVLLYSMSGGLLAFIAMHLLKRVIPERQLPVISVFGAICHNAGQILMAVLLTGSASLFLYLPLLCASGIVTGAFTGFAAHFTLIGLRRNKALMQLRQPTKKK